MRNNFVTASAGLSGGAVTHRCVLIPDPARPVIPPGRLKYELSNCQKTLTCGGLAAFPNLSCRHSQFTNRLIRTFITMPRARNVNSTEDPP